MTDPSVRRNARQRPVVSGSHGSGGIADAPRDVHLNDETLEQESIRSLQTIEAFFTSNQDAYLNRRQQLRQSPQGIRTVSRAGYDQLLSLQPATRSLELSRIEQQASGRGSPIFRYFPPRTNEGIRPFDRGRSITYVVMHSFGRGYDFGQLKRSRTRTVPVEPNTGHSPKRWLIGLNTILKPGAISGSTGQANTVAIHHMVSLRGDLINSVSWDNRCVHGEGGGYGLGINDRSIGIEHEEYYILSPGMSKPREIEDHGPFSEEQYAIDAFLLKKLQAYTGQDFRVFLGHGEVARQNIRNRVVGCFNHVDSSKHADPGGDFFLAPDFLLGVSDTRTHESTKARAGAWERRFEIWYPHLPRGTAISAYARIFDKVGRLRSFNLATEVFDPSIGGGPIDVATPAVRGTYTAAAAGAAARDRVIGMDRTQQAQQQTRTQVFNDARNSAAVSADAWSQGTARLAQATRATVRSPVIANLLRFDFTTGLWITTNSRSEPSNTQLAAREASGDRNPTLPTTDPTPTGET